MYSPAHAYLFRPDEVLCCVYFTRRICCKFLASDGVIFGVIARQSFTKSPVHGVSLLHDSLVFNENSKFLEKFFKLFLPIKNPPWRKARFSKARSNSEK